MPATTSHTEGDLHRLAALLHAAAGQQREDSPEGRAAGPASGERPKPSRAQQQAAFAAAANTDPDLKSVLPPCMGQIAAFCRA